jgi:CBS domain-containing protein
MLQVATPLVRSPELVGAVGQFMRWPAPVLAPKNTVADAADFLAEHSASHGVVIAGGEVCGLVCALDLLELEDNDHLLWAMTPPAAVVFPSTPLSEAEALLRSCASCALVVDAGDAYGILSRDDLANSGLDRMLVCALCGSAHRVSAGEPGEPAYCWECRDLLVRRDLDRLCRELG